MENKSNHHWLKLKVTSTSLKVIVLLKVAPLPQVEMSSLTRLSPHQVVEPLSIPLKMLLLTTEEPSHTLKKLLQMVAHITPLIYLQLTLHMYHLLHLTQLLMVRSLTALFQHPQDSKLLLTILNKMLEVKASHTSLLQPDTEENHQSLNRA
jgi:hypothetical protein